MPRFRYRGFDRKGAQVRGDLTADSRASALLRLREREITITDLAEGAAGPKESIWQRDLLAGDTLSDRSFARIAREMALLVSARVPMDRMLAILERTAPDKQARAWMKAVAARVREGETLSQACAEVHPRLPDRHLGLMRAGETSGALASALTSLADYLEAADASRRRIRGALVYPAFVLLAAFVTLILLVTLVLPTFEGIFASAGQSLPEPSNTILQIGKWLRGNALQVTAGTLGAVLFLVLVTRSETGKVALARLVLALPVIGPLRRRIDSARFARTASLLVGNGVQIDVAAGSAVASIGNAALRRQAAAMVPLLISGATVAEALHRTEVLDPLVADMAEVGAEAGQMPQLLLHAADLLEAQAEARANTLVTLIAPMATIVLGGLVAVVIMSVMSAMLQLNSLI